MPLFDMLCIFASYASSGGAQKGDRSTFATIARRYRAFSRIQGLHLLVVKHHRFSGFLQQVSEVEPGEVSLDPHCVTQTQCDILCIVGNI